MNSEDYKIKPIDSSYQMRNMGKMNNYNDGTRTLFESVMNIYVLKTLEHILKHNTKEVLDKIIITDGLAISFHSKPYTNTVINFLVNEKDSDLEIVIPININEFKIKINKIILDNTEYTYIKNICFVSNGFNIISPNKLINYMINDPDKNHLTSKIINSCNIKYNEIDESKHEKLKKFIYNLNLDYNMKHLNKFKDYFTYKIYEASSGYPEVDLAFNDWTNTTSDIKQVLIGGMALINHNSGIENYDRTTTDVDFLFLSEEEKPTDVYKFKKHRLGAFLHTKTHVEVEVLSPNTINTDENIVKLVMDTAYDKGNYKIASPSGIIVLKLGRFSEQDKKDIKILSQNFTIDIEPYIPYLSEKELENYYSII